MADKSSNVAIFAALIVAVLAIAGYFLFADDSEQTTTEGSPNFQFQDDDGDSVTIDF